MHAVIIDNLEQYLSGHLPPSATGRFQAHLANCSECRQELDEMRESSILLAALKPDGPVDPPPSFVAQVMLSVAGQTARSYWNSFRAFAFGRRVVFAALLTLAVLGTVLVSREQAYAPNPTTPEAVMADAAGSPNADQMLVTLANYEP
jgi:anti-sigma factor RsiW